MSVEVIYALRGKERQKLAQDISEALRTVPFYRGVPSCAYDIGDCVLDREGTLHIGDSLDSESVKSLLSFLSERGYTGRQQYNHTHLVVSLPLATLNEKGVENLLRMFKSKGELIGKAIGMKLSAPAIGKEKVSFAWFPPSADPEEVDAYTQFIHKLCAMAAAKMRVNEHTQETDNEKYAFRCFLLRLGFIGEKYKNVRKILLRNLSGDAAFRHGVKK